jgi:hypothetical protein
MLPSAAPDAALRRHGVRARRKHLGQHGHLEACLRQLQRRAHAGPARPHDHCIELPFRNIHQRSRDLDRPAGVRNQQSHDRDFERKRSDTGLM